MVSNYTQALVVNKNLLHSKLLLTDQIIGAVSFWILSEQRWAETIGPPMISGLGFDRITNQ